MKVLTFTFLIFSYSLISQNKETVYFDTVKSENGITKEINSYLYSTKRDKMSKLNSRHGKHISFFQTGEIETIRYYKNGTQDSLYTKYFKNGNKEEEGYLTPQKNSYWTFWYENGKKKEEGFYIEGKRVNNWIFYDSIGNKKIEVLFQDSLYFSTKYLYFNNGKLKAKEMYKGPYLIKANFSCKELNQTGVALIIDTLKDFEHIPIREWVKYDEVGNVIERKNFKD